MEDHYEKFPSSLSPDQEQRVVEQLNAGLENLRKKQEEATASEQAQEPLHVQKDPSEYNFPTDFFQDHTEPPQNHLQEQADKEWQDHFEGLQKEPGEHTSAEFETLLKAGTAHRSFEVSEGNTAVIRTLTQAEELEALRRASSWPDNSQSRVFLLFCVSQSLMSLNSRPWYRRKPLSDSDDLLQEKFEVLCKLNSSLVDKLIFEYRKLSEETAQKAIYAGKG